MKHKLSSQNQRTLQSMDMARSSLTTMAVKTEQSISPAKQQVLRRLQHPEYLKTVSFYKFIREKNTQDFQQPDLVGSQGYRDPAAPQLNANEKERFRGLLIASQKRFRGDDGRVKTQQTLDQYIQQGIITRKPKPKHQVQLRNNNLIFEQQQKELKKITLQNFIRGEKLYFDKLKTLQVNGQDTFLRNCKLRQKYYFDNLVPTPEPFLNTRDLFPNQKLDTYAQPATEWTSRDREEVKDKLQRMTGFQSQFSQLVSSMRMNKPAQQREQGADLDVHDLFFKYVRLNQLEEIKEMLKMDPELVNIEDSKGRSPFMLACLRGYKEMVLWLSQYPVDLTKCDLKGRTAKDLTMRNGQQDLLNVVRAMEKRLLFDRQTYLETILELIEDQQQVEMPLYFYYGLINVFFFQCIGYIYSNYEVKPIGDQKAAYMARIGEISPGTFLLYYKGNDVLTMMGLVLINGALVFYFCYIGFIIFMKQKQQYFYEEIKPYLTQINKLLNVFLTFYWWVFSVPFLEINIGVMMCGNNAFLLADRMMTYDDCHDSKSWGIYLFCSMGVLLTFCTGAVVILFFRNYKFNEENKLKRRCIPWISILQLCARTGVMACYYIGTQGVLTYKHLIGYILSVSLLVDIYAYFPFTDIRVTKYYIAAALTFQVLIMMTTIWLFTPYFGGYQIFYSLFTIVPPAVYVAYGMFQRSYDSVMLDYGQTIRTIEYTDYFTEQLSFMAENANVDQVHKIRMLHYITQHKRICTTLVCQCRNSMNPMFRHENVVREIEAGNADITQINNMVENLQINKSVGSMSLTSSSQMPSRERRQSERLRSNLIKKQKKPEDTESVSQTIQTLKSQQEEKQEEEERLKKTDEFFNFVQFYKFLTGIMKSALENQHITRNQVLFEQLSLKYISFLAKYRNNAARSYYELRQVTKQAKLSFYFAQLSKILASQIQNMIVQQQQIGMNQEDDNSVGKGTSKILQKLEGFEHRRQVSEPMINLASILEMEEQAQRWQVMTLAYLRRKETFWMNYEVGFRTMKELQVRAERQSEELVKYREGFERLVKRTKDSNQNLLHYKIQYITCFLVLNDYLKGVAYEKLLQEYLNRDQSKGSKELSILKYILNENIILNVSLMRNKGYILNQRNGKLASFFGYSPEDFSKVISINQLMPNQISVIHHSLIDRYMKRGYSNLMNGSYREVFILNGRQHIEQVKLQLSNYFESKDDFTQLGALLKINQSKDFIVCDMYGRIMGITEQLFQNIKEKYLLLNTNIKRDKELEFSLASFMEKVTIFTLFPDLVDVFKRFVLVLLDGKREVDPDQAVEELLHSRINELIVVKNQRSQMVICQDFIDHASFFKETVEHLIEGVAPDRTEQIQRTQFFARLATQRPGSKGYHLHKFTHRARVKKNSTLSKPQIGLSLLNLLELGEAEELVSEYQGYLQDAVVFKYFTKLEIKCNVIAQNALTSPNEIYFTIQLNDRKISKEALYALFQLKSVASGDGENAYRGLKKMRSNQFKKSSPHIEDDQSPGLIGSSNKLLQSFSQHNKSQANNSSDSSDDNDSENQIEEDITLNSSFTEHKVSYNRHNKAMTNDIQSITTTSTKSSLLQGQQLIKRIVDDSRPDSLTKQFVWINLYMFLIFLLSFLLVQVLVLLEFQHILNDVKVLNEYKDINQVYLKSLMGSMIYVNMQRGGFPEHQIVNQVAQALMNSSFDEYSTSLHDNYPFILGYHDYKINVNLNYNISDRSKHQVQVMQFLSLMTDNLQSLQFSSPQLDLQSMSILYLNIENHRLFFTQSLDDMQSSIREYAEYREFIINILSFTVAAILLFPIGFSFRINNKINRYYTLVLNVISRISFPQSANQRDIVGKAIMQLASERMEWAYFDFKELCMQVEDKIQTTNTNHPESKKKMTFNYAVLSERVRANKISSLYSLISVYFVVFFVASVLYYNSINQTLRSYVDIHQKQISNFGYTTQFLLTSEVLALQPYLTGQYSSLVLPAELVVPLEKTLKLCESNLNGFIQNTVESLPDNQQVFADIKKILIDDICSSTDDALSLKICKDSDSGNFYKSGIGGIISLLLKFHDTYWGTASYYMSDQHEYLYWLSFPLIDWSFNQITTSTVQLINTHITKEYSHLLIFWYLIGFAGLLGQAIIGLWIYVKIRMQIQNHKQMLTLLPYSQLEENSTIHLLKQLQEFK